MIVLITLTVIVFGGALGGIVWFVLHAKRSTQAKKMAREGATAEPLSFHWSYVILPLALLLFSIMLAAYFYHQLPPQVAAHFKLDGTPDRWLSREMTMVWLLTPQFLLTLVAGAIPWGITKIGYLFKPAAGTWAKPERILSFMGNAIALPQLILCFTMLDIFSYNSYQRHIIPMWIFLLIVLGLATIALGVLLTLAISKTKRQSIPQPSQNAKE